jgi:catechol 2,3-dioxygenase-like lactoylglutathione lyase family enzyme
MKFAHARIVTNDVPGLTKFYQAVIGLKPEGDDRYVEFRAPSLTLAISSQRTIEATSAGATTPAANRSVILDFEVDDVDKERARLGRLVDEFVLEPTTQPWGNRAMLFRDPDGNLINVFAVPRAAAKA